MSVLPSFRHQRPETLEGALAAISFDDVPYAGGTELLLAMRAGLLRPESLVDLKRIPQLGVVELSDGRVHIGGSVTHRAVIHHPGLPEALPVLPQVLRKVGNPRVRASGTLGGNLCFAEPKSDVTTLLVALDATVELASVRGRRSLRVDELVLGPYTTTREEDELLTAISIPLPGLPAVYEKFQTMERPTVGVAGVATPDGGTAVVVGAVGGRPERFQAAPGDALSPGEVAASVEVIPDMTGSERYKRHVTTVLVERVLARLEAQR